MEGSADPFSASNQRYGLEEAGSSKVDHDTPPPLPNEGHEGEGEGGRKHMSAHERRLQKKKVSREKVRVLFRLGRLAHRISVDILEGTEDLTPSIFLLEI